MRAYRKEGAGGPLRKGDMTGREHMAHARRRVLRWLDERLRIGFSEWNSPGYYVYDIIPLLNLADFAVDPEIRTRAAMVMDLLIFDLALNSPTGAMAGSAGRVYFEGKNCVWEQAVRNPSELLVRSTRALQRVELRGGRHRDIALCTDRRTRWFSRRGRVRRG